jgi:hypothetical protein
MRYLKWTASAAVVCASLGSASLAANAATMSDCTDMARSVAKAFDANKNPGNRDVAHRLQSDGRTLCNAGMYGAGMVRYEKALQLLGGDGQEQAQTAAPAGHSQDD